MLERVSYAKRVQVVERDSYASRVEVGVFGEELLPIIERVFSEHISTSPVGLCMCRHLKRGNRQICLCYNTCTVLHASPIKNNKKKKGENETKHKK